MWQHILRELLRAATIAVYCAASHAGEPSFALSPCFGAAAQHYGIAPELLLAIARTESGLDPLAVHLNPDGSWDVGLMQINSRWLPALREMGIAAESLYEPCTSIWVGAWVLAGNIHRLGYTWQAVGAYNAGMARSPAARARRDAYAQRLARQLGPPAAPARSE